MSFKKLSDSLKDKFFRKDDLSKQLEIVKVFAAYKKEVERLFPEDQKTTPISLKNKVLVVKTSSSAMANELRFTQSQAILKINSLLGKEVLRRIIYRY